MQWIVNIETLLPTVTNWPELPTSIYIVFACLEGSQIRVLGSEVFLIQTDPRNLQWPSDSMNRF